MYVSLPLKEYCDNHSVCWREVLFQHFGRHTDHTESNLCVVIYVPENVFVESALIQLLMFLLKSGMLSFIHFSKVLLLTFIKIEDLLNDLNCR